MDKYYGNYKATVISKDDPKKLNRVQVQVNGLMNGIPKANLPWAKYHSHTAVQAKAGSWITPAVGSIVTVFFAEGDINDVYYEGGILENTNDQPSAVRDKRHILFESPDKHITIAFNDDTNKLEIKCGDYNTDLATLIDTFLNHAHYYITFPGGIAGPAVMTSAPDKNPGVPPAPAPPPVPPLPLPYSPADFKTGTL